MSTRNSIVAMLKQLLQDMAVLHQQGAGYYSCMPIIDRYNKLLGQTRLLFTDQDTLIATFEEQKEDDPKDPAYKMKIVQAIRIEVGQLIVLLEVADHEDDEQGEHA
mgnify:FL=1